MSVETQSGQPVDTKRSSQFFRQVKYAPYVFTAPFYILFFIFFLFPSLAAFVLSFFKWDGISDMQWLGLRNFQRLFEDPDFWQSVGNTLVYMFASLIIVVPLALVLAALLNTKELGMRDIWRSAYFTPVVTSSVAIALVFSLLYSKDYGLINAFFIQIGLPAVNWLGDGSWAKVSIIILLVWRWTGYLMIYFLAGMQSISQEYYEAAMIDGANAFQQFFRITIPLLRPVILYVSIIVTTGSLQIFEEPFILTSGGPANATLSISQYLYSRGISTLKFGLGSAVGLLLFLAIFGLSALQLRSFGLFKKE